RVVGGNGGANLVEGRAQNEGAVVEQRFQLGAGEAAVDGLLQIAAMREQRFYPHQGAFPETIAAIPVAGVVQGRPMIDHVSKVGVNQSVEGLAIHRGRGRLVVRRLRSACPDGHRQAGREENAPLGYLSHTIAPFLVTTVLSQTISLPADAARGFAPGCQAASEARMPDKGENSAGSAILAESRREGKKFFLDLHDFGGLR